MAADSKGGHCSMSDWDELKSISVNAYEFLKSFIPEEYEDGRYELQNGMYVNIESYTTQLREDRKFESHRRYIDVQYMISGMKLITVCPFDKLKCVEVYNQDTDIAFYQNTVI